MKPAPMPDEASLPYWEAARTGRLVMQRCAGCAAVQYPPDLVCGACQSESFTFDEVSGRGLVYSFAVYTRSFTPGFEAPYVLALIELEEAADLRMLTNLVGVDPEDVEVGMQVEVVFEDRGGWKVPQFGPARTGP